MGRAKARLAVALLVVLTAAAQAQDYPNRIIKMMHGFPPGGNVDVIARLMADEMSKGLGQSIVVEAKPGLAGSLAAEVVARAEPDGYTLLLVPSAHAVTGAISKNLKYKPIDDFEWISTVSFYPFVLVVRKDSKIRSLPDLLDTARASPGKITFGSAGLGTIHQMTAEMLANAAGVKLVHVPYRGEAPALTGLLSGDIDFIATTTTLAAARAQAGEVRALAVTSRMRWKELPDVPTIAESGIKDFEVISWSGVATKAGVPTPVAQRLNAEVHRAIGVPAVRARLESFGGEVRGTSPAEMRALVEKQLAQWARVAKDANIQAE
jgi:tripartite-type tricarboxylate transporter receptor subunit TctC